MWLGNLALNACFVRIGPRFGWGPQQSGPLLVVVGLMLAVVPKLVVPRLGVVGAANFGCLVYALGFICAALAPTGPQWAAIVVCGFRGRGRACLTSIVAGAADRNSKGTVLGGLQTLRSSRRPRLPARALAGAGPDGDTGIPAARRTSPRRLPRARRARSAPALDLAVDYIPMMYGQKTHPQHAAGPASPAALRRGLMPASVGGFPRRTLRR